jgi:CBS domain-containing protein
MLAISVEGFFAYALHLHRVGTRPFGRGRTAMLIRDVLNEKGRRVISIGPEASVKQALALFVEHNIGSLPVVEASGQVIGIFSERDVLRVPGTRVPGTPYLTVG